jgi:NAD(P)-dependent dehydrogenase (short-subunit alcohol dehydrogenase family)
LKGRIVLATGATQGIGLAIATAAASEGAEAVVIVGRDPAKAPAAVKAIEGAGAVCAFVQADLESPDAPDMIFDFAISRFARVDALVNSAAATDRGALVDADRPLWDRLFAVNVRAPFFLMQRLVKHLRQRGAPGSIVNVLSMHAHGGSPELAVYASTKAALAGLTRNTANAHRFDRIRVNGIALGWVDTPAERAMQAVTLGHGETWLEDASATQPFGRLFKPEDVARLALFLLGDASEPMTGAIVDQAQSVIGTFG